MQVINWRQVKRMYRKLTHLSPSVRIELENEHRPEINTANSHERRQRNTQAGICRFCFKKMASIQSVEFESRHRRVCSLEIHRNKRREGTNGSTTSRDGRSDKPCSPSCSSPSSSRWGGLRRPPCPRTPWAPRAVAARRRAAPSRSRRRCAGASRAARPPGCSPCGAAPPGAPLARTWRADLGFEEQGWVSGGGASRFGWNQLERGEEWERSATEPMGEREIWNRSKFW